ncbi:F0F1 ATP synthase subunit delta [Candidatus Purcelliella pentastirinorum]|uniref:ATP synthase subunit delta n=2 Tax=Candidatus Purcelliella pentastirinorum TaxID=472834 RepID=A0A346DZT8_9ENTR|nr:F0F1 ATP synthase subunit delta [Candidatus Purcelliella pentastirinorum]AXN02243.1 ATP synthase delta chain [Candidatus Purcelliella pentastirinorum]WDI78798.1 F0F1 ATP synthase subunit delta [Candidatus Purcelliella pentastirinorum]
MRNYITLSKIYANAIFSYSLKNKCTLYWHNMLKLTTNIINNNKMNSFFLNHHSTKEQFDVLINLLDNYISFDFKNFIKIVLYNRGLIIIPYIFKQFVKLHDQYKNNIIVNIESAYKLNKSQLFNIRKIISKKITGNIKINCKINRFIFAGIIINIENLILDGSLLNKLNILKKGML